MAKLKKFHINSNDEVKPCNATLRECRFGGTESHYENFTEAVKVAETRLSQKNSVTTTVKKGSNKNARKDVEILKSKIDELFNENINISSSDVDKFVSYLKNFSPDNLVKIGEIFDEELSKRVSFDIFEQQLSQEQLKTVEEETHKLMNELTTTGESLSNDVYGSLSKQLNKAVEVLPNSVKKRLSGTPILAKATRIDNNKFDGQHSGNTSFGVSVKSSGAKIGEIEREMIKDLEDGTVYIRDFVYKDEMGKGWGSRAKVKRADSDIYDEVWIGEGLSTKSRGKKISDSSKVHFNGKLQTIDKPMYEIKDTKFLQGSVILAKKDYTNNAESSVLLHEYVHLVQLEDNTFAESQMFAKLKKEEYFDESLSVKCYKGFPDEYMGLYNGRELLTRASEGFYYPSSNSYLYGSSRGDSADEVRRWIMGYWIARNRSLS